MQIVQIHGPDDVRMDDIPQPEPGPDDVVVRVQSCGICGSDLGYVKLGGLAGPGPAPMPIGHEFSGIVDKKGANVRSVAEGARVVVNPLAAGNAIGNGGPEGAFASHLLVRNVESDRCLYEIPDAMSFDVAALSEPLGVGMQAVDRAGVVAGEKAVVFGAGPIGLATATALHDRGVEDIIAVDLSDTRLAIARKLAAAKTINASNEDVWQRIREIHGTSPVMGAPMAGTDAYIEASGASPLIGQILAQAKSKARVSVVALHRSEVPVNFLLVMMKQLCFVGSMAYPDDWTQMIDLLGRADVSTMITHHFPLDRFDEALATAKDPAAGAKVVIDLTR